MVASQSHQAWCHAQIQQEEKRELVGLLPAQTFIGNLQQFSLTAVVDLCHPEGWLVCPDGSEGKVTTSVVVETGQTLSTGNEGRTADGTDCQCVQKICLLEWTDETVNVFASFSANGAMGAQRPDSSLLLLMQTPERGSDLRAVPRRVQRAPYLP